MARKVLTSRFWWSYSWLPRCNRLLEIGGGTGEVANEYRKKAKEVYLIEFNQEYIKSCRKMFPKIHASVAPAEKIPFQDGFFDAVVMTDTFEHVYDEKKSVEEVWRVLKKGGTLILSTPHKGLLDWMDAFNLKYRFPKLYGLWKREKAEEILKSDAWHRHYSLEDYERFFRGKFVIEKVHKGGFLLWYLLWIFHDAFIAPVWGNKAPDWIMKPIDWLNSLDYAMPYGRIAAHIILKAEKQ